MTTTDLVVYQQPKSFDLRDIALIVICFVFLMVAIMRNHASRQRTPVATPAQPPATRMPSPRTIPSMPFAVLSPMAFPHTMNVPSSVIATSGQAERSTSRFSEVGQIATAKHRTGPFV
ncbi:uncharacterized protein BKA78DRAFT_295402 [Phyllosticta capitalensis]|uniref:uncharacterized protein n=1 Tax=Phyllosticta capitalensis TaxID=121624 RepID=UPI00312E3F8E